MILAIIKKRINMPSIRYILAAPFSAFMAVMIPSYLVRFLDIEKDMAFYITLIILFFINFFVSYNFVFRQQNKIKVKMFKYAIAAIIFRMLDAAWYNIYSSFMDINYEILIIISIGTTFSVKFFVYKFFIFTEGR